MKTSKLHITAILALLLVAGALIGCSSLGDGFLFPEGQAAVRFLFTFNDDGTVTAFRVNPDTGALTMVAGSPFNAVDDCCGALDATHDGRFVFVVSKDAGQLAVLSVNQDTGALTAVGTPSTVAECPRDVKVTPSGSFLFVTDPCNDNLHVFAVGSTGALTETAGSPYEQGPSPWGIAVDPQSRFVFVTDGGNQGNDTIRAYAIGANGALTEAPGSPFTAGNAGGLRFPVTDHSGKFLYATNANTDSVYAFTISQTDGSLTDAGEFDAGLGPVGISAHPTLDLIAVANWDFSDGENQATSVSVFSINTSTGALTDVPGSPFPLDDAVHQLAFDTSGKFIYLAQPYAGDGSGLIRGYTVDANGHPTELPGSPFTGALNNDFWLTTTR
jgi:6-phosphogluconolactonase